MMIDSDALFYFLTIVYSTTHHMCTTSSALTMLGFSIFASRSLMTPMTSAGIKKCNIHNYIMLYGRIQYDSICYSDLLHLYE